jgi:hypothetical protein
MSSRQVAQLTEPELAALAKALQDGVVTFEGGLPELRRPRRVPHRCRDRSDFPALQALSDYRDEAAGQTTQHRPVRTTSRKGPIKSVRLLPGLVSSRFQ